MSVSVSVVVTGTKTKALRILFPFGGEMYWSKEKYKNTVPENFLDISDDFKSIFDFFHLTFFGTWKMFGIYATYNAFSRN